MRQLLRDKGLLAAAVLYLAYLGGLWLLNCTEGSRRVTVYDQVALPGEQIPLSAKLERNGPVFVDPDLHGVRVRIGIETAPGPAAEQPSAPAGEAETGADGIARIERAAPGAPGSYRITLEPIEKKPHAYEHGHTAARLFVLDPGRSLVVCDIDGTVTAGGKLQVFFGKRGPKARPGAASTLHKVVEHSSLIYLTAREDAFLNATRDWLEERRFPRAPVIARDWKPATALRPGESKVRVLKEWRRRFGAIRWGIGDSKGDCDAYRAAGIPHITFGASYCPAQSAVPCTAVKTWAAAASKLLAEQEPAAPRRR